MERREILISGSKEKIFFLFLERENCGKMMIEKRRDFLSMFQF